MKTPRFQLPNGELIPQQLTNKHHIVYESYNYESGLARRYRESAGLIIRMYIDTHNELHREVEPPIIPSPNLMRKLVDYGRRRDIRASSYERFCGYIQYLNHLSTASESQQICEEAEQLGENFKAQDYFISRGRVIWHS